LFEAQKSQSLAPKPEDIYKNIDADYYGYRDEEDEQLLDEEVKVEQTIKDDMLSEGCAPQIDDDEEARLNAHLSVTERLAREQMPLVEDIDPALEMMERILDEWKTVPSQRDVEAHLVMRRKQVLMDKYNLQQG